MPSRADLVDSALAAIAETLPDELVEAKYDVSPLGTGKNWVTDVGGLPLFIRAIAHALIRNGHSESSAIANAVGAVKRWAEGRGGVTAKTRAKAAAALAEWEAKKVAARGKGALKKVGKAAADAASAGDSGKKGEPVGPDAKAAIERQLALDMGMDLSDVVVDDEKGILRRLIRTEAGVRKYKEPIGSPIGGRGHLGAPNPEGMSPMARRAFAHAEDVRVHPTDAMAPPHTTSAERHAAMGGHTVGTGLQGPPRRLTRALGTPRGANAVSEHLNGEHEDSGFGSLFNGVRNEEHLKARHLSLHGGDLSGEGHGHTHDDLPARTAPAEPQGSRRQVQYALKRRPNFKKGERVRLTHDQGTEDVTVTHVVGDPQSGYQVHFQTDTGERDWLPAHQVARVPRPKLDRSEPADEDAARARRLHGFRVMHDGEHIGYARQVEKRTPVYAGGTRTAQGFRVRKVWQVRDENGRKLGGWDEDPKQGKALDLLVQHRAKRAESGPPPGDPVEATIGDALAKGFGSDDRSLGILQGRRDAASSDEERAHYEEAISRFRKRMDPVDHRANHRPLAGGSNDATRRGRQLEAARRNARNFGTDPSWYGVEHLSDDATGVETKGDDDMTIEHKSAAVSDVRVIDEEAGIVETVVSVTGLVDRVKDRILPGAYEKSLQERLPKGVWSHDWSKPVSRTLSASELRPGDPRLPDKVKSAGGGGLLITTQFNLDTERGRDAFSDVKFFGDDQEWSIGYKVPAGGATYKKGIREISRLDVFEYSPVLFGAMPLAKTISVKDAQAAWKAASPILFPECDESGTCCAACGAAKGVEGKADGPRVMDAVDCPNCHAKGVKPTAKGLCPECGKGLAPGHGEKSLADVADDDIDDLKVQETDEDGWCVVDPTGARIQCFDTQEEAEKALADAGPGDDDGDETKDLEGKVWDGEGWVEEKDLYTASAGSTTSQGFGETADLSGRVTGRRQIVTQRKRPSTAHRFAGPKGGKCKICGKPFQAGAHHGAKAPHEVVDEAKIEDLDEYGEKGVPQAVRDKADAEGNSLDDGRYPIPNVAYLKKAIQAYGRCPEEDRAKLRALIKRRAKELGAEDLVPDFSDDSGSKGEPAARVAVEAGGTTLTLETKDFDGALPTAVMDAMRDVLNVLGAAQAQVDAPAEVKEMAPLTPEELDEFDQLRLRA